MKKKLLQIITPLCGIALAVLVITAIIFGQAGNTLTWDYGISPDTDVLCSAKVTQDCIQSFALAYESAPAVFTQAATIPVSACAVRTQTGGGWTCTAPIPTVAGRKYKLNNWTAWATSVDSFNSINSNTTSKQVKPGTALNLRTP